MAIKITMLSDTLAVDESGCKYIVREHHKGINKKLWLTKENGTFAEQYMVKFASRKPGIVSDLNLYNEVMCSRICDALELRHVDYELCEVIALDGTITRGVVCQNYKEKPQHNEVNGRTIHEFFCNWHYDNNFGDIPNVEINTIYAFLEQLKLRFESRRMTMSEETENKLLDQMLTLALFDFCTCQIDRHWGNVGWLNNNIYDDDSFKINLIPIYDNECSFLMDEITEENLNKLIANINSEKKVQVAIDAVNKKRTQSPCLGIRTSLVRIKEGTNGHLVPLSNNEQNLSNAQIAARELAHEIMTRPTLKEVYDRMETFNIEDFVSAQNFIPEEQAKIKDVYAFVWTTRLQLLKDSMDYIKKHGEGENRNETTGLSSL